MKALNENYYFFTSFTLGVGRGGRETVGRNVRNVKTRSLISVFFLGTAW